MAVPILFICCVLYVPSLSAAPPFCGDNELGLRLKSPADSHRPPYMEELEIVVEDN